MVDGGVCRWTMEVGMDGGLEAVDGGRYVEDDRRQKADVSRWTIDNGRWTKDGGSWTGIWWTVNTARRTAEDDVGQSDRRQCYRRRLAFHPPLNGMPSRFSAPGLLRMGRLRQSQTVKRRRVVVECCE